MELKLHVKRIVRKLAGSHANCPVVVVDGMKSPEFVGSGPHYTTRGGKPIYHPSAYSRFGWSNMVYHGSTLRVEVGSTWLRSHGLAQYADSDSIVLPPCPPAVAELSVA